MFISVGCQSIAVGPTLVQGRAQSCPPCSLILDKAFCPALMLPRYNLQHVAGSVFNLVCPGKVLGEGLLC